MATYGLEEEVFVCEPERPTLKSLYYLAKLLWRNPRLNYVNTASNFARGKDVEQGLMSGIEVATRRHSTPEELFEDLLKRRKELSSVCEGLIVPLGHLINYQAPTNVCALQIHVGDVKDQRKVYNNLAYFLPILTLLTINAPYADGKYFGQSFRIANAYAIGPLKDDWTARFQDIILAKRLNTIELRVFDPTWDLERIKILLETVDVIVQLEKDFPLDVERYNRWRKRLVKEGYSGDLKALWVQLKDVCEISEDLLRQTSSDYLKDYYEKNGLVKTYSALDNAYRNGLFEPGPIPKSRANLIKGIAGFTGYYIPKLPYIVWKYLRES